MPIKLLPDGTPEEQARMAKTAALAERIHTFLNAQKVTTGSVIDALGLLFALMSANPEQAGKYATDLSVAIGAHYRLKQKD